MTVLIWRNGLDCLLCAELAQQRELPGGVGALRVPAPEVEDLVLLVVAHAHQVVAVVGLGFSVSSVQKPRVLIFPLVIWRGQVRC